MSYIAAMVLMIVEDDETLAWMIFIKILEINQWQRMYTHDTPKLFEVTKELKVFMKSKMPKLNACLNQNNAILESFFASPFLTLFSNLIPIDLALKVLDNFIFGIFICNLTL